MMEKIYSFSSSEEARKFMRVLEVPASKIEHTLRHESTHFNRAKELGYNPDYVIFTSVINSREVFQRCSVGVNGVSPRDSIDIALAPEEPSLQDIEEARIASLVLRSLRRTAY